MRLPKKYQDPFKDVPNNTGESFKTIDELRDFFNRKKLYKQYRRIKI